MFSTIEPEFFRYLETFRFTGDVWAMDEGTPFFPNEPVLARHGAARRGTARRDGSPGDRQLSNHDCQQGRAYRSRGGRETGPGVRGTRAHGLEAALYAARAAHLAGCTSTSFVDAGRQFGIRFCGTMAHSWILAAANEREAFIDFAGLFGDSSVLLLDQFDVAKAVEAVVASGLRPAAVRLDSGDLLLLARSVRQSFDGTACTETRIIASGDLDEWKIRELVVAEAPIDAYAVGTALTTSDDAPALGGVYKLVEIDGPGGARLVLKRSAGKRTQPGAKQVWRTPRRGSRNTRCRRTRRRAGTSWLSRCLRPVMRAGARTREAQPLASLRAGCAERFSAMPDAIVGISTQGSSTASSSVTGSGPYSPEPGVSRRQRAIP